jgi:2-polyprenyl-3-methyl-5-hydroxy-6-metoxy-1,4-benzoquinol methylase
MGGSRSHWDNVYATKAETAVSWFQPHSMRSLELIDAASADRKASVIDVGGGASTLVDDLLARGFGDVTVLDIADSALERSKARLGKDADKVEWVVADITRWTPGRTWNIWHVRAVFHFLTERAQQDAYIVALIAGTKGGATIIIATFALDGPETCSGLAVQRYSPETLASRLGSAFALTAHANEAHKTPWGSEQRFSYAVLKRR